MMLLYLLVPRLTSSFPRCMESPLARKSLTLRTWAAPPLRGCSSLAYLKGFHGQHPRTPRDLPSWSGGPGGERKELGRQGAVWARFASRSPRGPVRIQMITVSHGMSMYELALCFSRLFFCMAMHLLCGYVYILYMYSIYYHKDERLYHKDEKLPKPYAFTSSEAALQKGKSRSLQHQTNISQYP